MMWRPRLWELLLDLVLSWWRSSSSRMWRSASLLPVFFLIDGGNNQDSAWCVDGSGEPSSAWIPGSEPDSPGWAAPEIQRELNGRRVSRQHSVLSVWHRQAAVNNLHAPTEAWMWVSSRLHTTSNALVLINGRRWSLQLLINPQEQKTRNAPLTSSCWGRGSRSLHQSESRSRRVDGSERSGLGSEMFCRF